MSRAAVVTGSNKGIGLAVVKGLCVRFNGIVYLTARNPELGKEATEQLKTELTKQQREKLRFHQLDITDRKTITALKEHLLNAHGGLDILINNASIAFWTKSTVEFGEQVRVTLDNNYRGTKTVCDALFPILRPHARVVTVVGRMGQLSRGYSQQLQDQLTRQNLTFEQLDEIVDRFVRLAADGAHVQNGYPNNAYTVSKTAQIALSCIQHRQLSSDISKDIVINWCCPGGVKTYLSRQKGELTTEEGADTILYLALLPENVTSPRGKFIAERREVDWHGNHVFTSD